MPGNSLYLNNRGFLVSHLRFKQNMLSPCHAVWLAEGFSPVDGETVVDCNWRLNPSYPEDEIVTAAAEDLLGFLRNSMLVELHGKGTESAINLCRKTLPGGSAEAYSIDVQKNGITITGAGSAGIMYGIYALEEMMKERGGPAVACGTYRHSPIFETRIYRSPLAQYHGVDELFAEPEPYPETVLREMSRHGMNGIWMRGILRNLAKNTAFPELGEGCEERIHRLNRLIERAAKYNIRVYLYMTEPLGFKEDDLFFTQHPEARGVRYAMPENWGGNTMWGGAENALCSSTPKVKQYLSESTTNLFKSAPGLGGLILITASEHHHHCYSHIDLMGMQQGDEQFATVQECPRCKKRTPAEVVSEIINTIHRSATNVDPSAKVIAWNWAWRQYEPEPQKNLISMLDPGVILMGGFEAGAKLNIEGKETVNEEYSLSYAGPSERFRDAAQFARENGRRVFAKIQVGTTHEDANIPYLPVMNKVAEKLKNMADEGVSGYMGCWNFGNFLSPVTEITHRMSWLPQPDGEDLLRRMAERDYGRGAAPFVLQAWKEFCRATDHFPLCMFLLGLGVHTRGPVYPFRLTPSNKPTALNWRVVPYTDWGDDHTFWTEKLGLPVILTSCKKLLVGWEAGLYQLEAGIKLAQGDCRGRLEKHLGVAKLFYHQYKSSLNFLNFVEARDAMQASSNTAESLKLLACMEKTARDELEHCQEVSPLLANDPQLGFHGEAFAYLLDEAGVNRKIAELTNMLEHEIPQYKKELEECRD
ncbi:MAG TPA: hypothetical protein DCL60_07460 [Armatimonadetes bacterium]|nr:hypothetical protein [Armatimonadota bacterium]